MRASGRKDSRWFLVLTFDEQRLVNPSSDFTIIWSDGRFHDGSHAESRYFTHFSCCGLAYRYSSKSDQLAQYLAFLRQALLIRRRGSLYALRPFRIAKPAQHQAVEAGAPFEQLIKAGIRTARLDKILRQRTDLRKPVELLSQKEVLAAVSLLESQGRITEIKDDLERLRAIASDYVTNPKGTLIISPANSERVAINTIIHQQLQERGVVRADNHRLTVLVNRQDMTGPERTFALAYSPGEDIIRYNTTSKLYGVKPGNYGRVLANNHKENTITVRFDSGREITYNPARLSGVSVYREAQRDFAVGERIQFRAPFAKGKVKNSELGTIKEIADGKMTVRLDKKRDVVVPLDQFRHLDHGYAVTSHSSQGQTVNRVLVNAETIETDLLLNQRMAYVAISRARFEARIYTDSLKDLGPAFNRERNKEIALDALAECQPNNSNDGAAKLTAAPVEDPDWNQEGRLSPSAIQPPEQESRRVVPFSDQIRELNARLILGQKLAAELNEKYAAKRLQEALDQRDLRRYLASDKTTGLRREMSVRDVEHRATHVAARLAVEQVATSNGDQPANRHDWKELRDSEYARQMEQHDSTISEILDAHAKEVRTLTVALHNARKAHVHFASTAQSVESALQAGGNQLLVPIIPHERLNELQLTAIRSRDADAFEHLEKIRHETPHELGGPERDTFSFARLNGQAVVAQSNQALAQKRLSDFEKSRHFAKVEIDGEQWSLAGVDRQQRLAEREIEFHRRTISAYRKRLYGALQNPIKLYNIGEYKERANTAKEEITNAREQIRNVQPIRDEVKRLIDEHRDELEANVRKEQRIATAIGNAVEQETLMRAERGQELPRAEFNATEPKRLEEAAITLRNPDLLLTAQREMESHFGQTKAGPEWLAARSAGRAEAAEVVLQELNARIENFSEQRQFFPVLFKSADGEEKTASLHDLQPRTLTEKVFSFLSPKDRLDMNAVDQGLDQHHFDLLSERDSLEQFVFRAREIAKSYEQSLPTLDQQLLGNAERRLLQPAFTAREIAQVENFAAQQGDLSIRAQFETMMRSPLTIGQVGNVTGLSRTAERWEQSQIPGLNPAQIQATGGDYLEAAKSMLDKVAADADEQLRTMNEAAVAAERMQHPTSGQHCCKSTGFARSPIVKSAFRLEAMTDGQS